MDIPLTSSSSLVFSLLFIRNMVSVLGYDDKKLYDYGKKILRIDLVYLVERYESISKKRLELSFVESLFGQDSYNRGGIFIYHLIGISSRSLE